MAKPTCTVLECTRPGIARGMCNSHYRRGRRSGELSLIPRPATAAGRFAEKWTLGESGCWEWQGAKNNRGYGWFSDGKRMLAHRWSYARYVGPIAAGVEVMHTCDNPPCVNPTHLRVGSHADNMADAASKGRSVQGERQAGAKLTEDDVRWLRSMPKAPRQKAIALGVILGVEEHTVYSVQGYRSWKHVE